MGRLIVDAVDAELLKGHFEKDVNIAVSVSLADDGSAVSGLEEVNFRIVEMQSMYGKDFHLTHAAEAKWDPTDTQPSGCYLLSVEMVPNSGGAEMVKGRRYTFGVGVRVFNRKFELNGPPPRLVHQGQTVVSVINMAN